jgi:hypothetical protein
MLESKDGPMQSEHVTPLTTKLSVDLVTTVVSDRVTVVTCTLLQISTARCMN